MARFARVGLPTDTVVEMYAERQTIDLDPSYQRQSDLWGVEKRQLLIDSIINNFDLPKFYLNDLTSQVGSTRSVHTYAIIDGKQRLQAIWGFIDGDFVLDNDFEYISDPSVDLSGLSYTELGKQYPLIKARFDAYHLAVTVIQTDDTELIEDMFTRLNDGTGLNAAEKRNAFGGPIPENIRNLEDHQFFKSRVPFSNRRYRHRDIGAKFLWVEARDQVVDTKKRILDEFVRGFSRRYRNKRQRGRAVSEAEELERKVRKVLGSMARVFRANDPLLRRVGMITLYYYLFRFAQDTIKRQSLLAFEEELTRNREVWNTEPSKANLDLVEFDEHRQSVNDGYALRTRLRILAAYLEGEHGIGVSVPAAEGE